MAKSRIPKPSSVTKVRRPKAAPVTKETTFAEVCKPRDASADPKVFLGELVEETIPEVDNAASEQSTDIAQTSSIEEVSPIEEVVEEQIEEPIEETTIEELQVEQPLSERREISPVIEVEPDDSVDVVPEKVVPAKKVVLARIVVKCASYMYRGRRVNQGQSFVVEGEDIFKFGNVDMFDIFPL